MKARDFCYWLQGYFELSTTVDIKPQQLTTIKNHLNMVFIHEIDPSFPDNQQNQLNEAHSGAIMRC